MLAIASQPTPDPAELPARRRSSSARAVLQALALLARSPGGLRADEAAEALGRSVSTAYSLLDALCQEGFAIHEQRGTYHLAASVEAATVPANAAVGETLSDILDELFARTNKRAYLAAADAGSLVIPAMRGRQGMRRMPGLGRTIGQDAHALALGKVALSMLSPDGLGRYVERGLRRYTQDTIVRPEELLAQLETIRADGFAVDVEEHEPDFCCVASPVLDSAGRVVAVVGISMSRHAFDHEHGELSQTVRDVASQARMRLPPGPPAALPENGRGS